MRMKIEFEKINKENKKFMQDQHIFLRFLLSNMNKGFLRIKKKMKKKTGIAAIFRILVSVFIKFQQMFWIENWDKNWLSGKIGLQRGEEIRAEIVT